MGLNNKILPLRKQVEVRDNWLQFRLKNILLGLMKRAEIDMWVILAREYNEDPVLKSLLPASMMNASRLTGLIFSREQDGTVEYYSLYPKGSEMMKPFYESIWDKENGSQWDSLKRLISDKKPKKIGVNTSQTSALADGLSKSLYDEFLESLDDSYKKAVVSAEDLAIGWLETRSEKELQIYSGINNIIHSIIEEAFSTKTINVGVTTTTDLEWWMMEKVQSLGLNSWFPFDVDLQRCGETDNRMSNEVIMPGDLLRCDVGLEYLGLKTDTQRLAYVLKLGENDIPEGIKSAMATGNRFQDIVCGNFIEGKTGNEIFKKSIEQAKEEGIDARLYSHPIGVHGHGAGPTIGLWDNQVSVSGKGEYKLHANTCYALELNISQKLPEWDNQELFICLEQTIAFTNNKVIYLDGRQTEILKIN